MRDAAALPTTVTRHSARAQAWRRVGWVVFYAGLSIGAVLMALPMVWMVTTSFKTEGAVFAVPIQWLPLPFRPDNYARACLQLTIPAPSCDRMIAEYLMLRNDEALYWRKANIEPVQKSNGKIATVLMAALDLALLVNLLLYLL